jgi:ABC-2 type transport system ATP-binding protein
VADKLETQLRHLSLGQRMKMEIIGAFLHDPEVVFLDEPTIGLDLVSRETIRRFLVEHNRERGATIVLTSHDIEDIEATCKRLVILEKGRVLHDGDIVALAHDLTSERRIEVHQHSLAFILPAARSQAFVRMLFERLAVRDLAVERRPLEDLVKQIFSGERRP